MTKDAWISLLVKVLLMVLTPLAAQLHINDGATLTAFATDIADGLVLLFGMYQQWNMKRVHVDAKVIAPLLIACLLVASLFQSARAADMTVKAAPAQPAASIFNPYPYGTSGFIVGLYTEGGSGSVSGSVPGVASASLTSTQAGAGLTVGWAWGKAGSPVAISLEGDFGWTNFNGSTAGLSLSGPAAFEQRVVMFTPLASIMNMLPGLSAAFGTVPPFATIDPSLKVSNLQLGLMAGLDENDISGSFAGVGSVREWRFAPMIGLVSMEQLSNGTAVRSWIKTVFPDRSVCAGPVKNACADQGQQIKFGLGVYY